MSQQQPHNGDEAYRSIILEEGANEAQRDANSVALSRGAIVDPTQQVEPEELLRRLTEADIESEEFDELLAELKPYLSQTQMLASHGDDFYDDLSRELLNENLADRVLAAREHGSLLTGPFLAVALQVEGYPADAPTKKPYSPSGREAVRGALVDVRTDRQSLGDGTFFKGVTEMHVSSEVRREDAKNGEEKRRGLLSALNPFSR